MRLRLRHPLLVLQHQDNRFGAASGAFITWLEVNGHAFHGSVIERPPATPRR